MRNLARILSVIAIVVLVNTADAQTVRTVMNAADSGTGSLRDALATCTPTPCEVRFDPTVFAGPTTIVLSSGLTVPNDVVIDGFTGIGSPNTASFPAPDNALRKVTIAAACTGCTAITFPAANTIPSGVKGLIIQGFSNGIFIQGSQAKVTGNWIRGNTNGVVISGATSTQLNYIGGQLPADRNIIGGNSGTGIQVSGPSVINTNIDGNFIGTGPTGTSADANGTGVSVSGAAGTAIGDVVGNLITGNGIGVSVGASTVPSTIRRNLIGITGLGNSNAGLEINANQTITEFNSFRGNVGDAVRVTNGIGNIIRDNIYESNGLPIDLQAFTSFDGPTPNDDGTGDSDAGGNNIQNYPAIQSAFYDPLSNAVTVTFNFNSVSAASNSYIIALHKAEPTGTNPGSLQLAGSQCFVQKVFAPNTTFFLGTGLAVGDRIVMTATGYADTACPTPLTVADGTSEFSPPAVVALQPGVVTNTSDSGPGSLRQAILDANSGVCPFTGCTVTFAIPTTDPGYNASTGTWTIQPATEYPAINRGDLYFDGTTQATFIGGDPNPAGPEIVISGSLLASPFANGFQVLASTAHVEFVEFQGLVINGFADNAIIFQGTSATAESRFHAVRRCYIGTNAAGTAAVPNGNGVTFGPFARNNQAGTGIAIPMMVAKSSATSFSSSGGNVISGNAGPGVLISHGTNNTVQGNRIGTDASGAFPLPNAIGVKIQGFMATGNKIGGDPFWAENNTIAFNTGSGIEVNSETTGHWFDRNSIHANGGLGIDLMPAGPTPNDLGDADTGANDLTNFPVITSVTYGASDTTVSGTMNGLPGATYEIQVFTSTAPDPSGFGEGQTYQASASVTTDVSGNGAWSAPVFSGVHRWVSATATYQPSALPRVTSEFSAVFNTAPAGVADTYSTNEDTVLNVTAPGVLGNDTDADGDPLTAVLVTGPASGSLTFSTDGSFTYTPVANFNGPVTFTYMPNDGLANGNTTTVTLNVIAVNDPPVAVADAFAGTEDVPLTQPAPGVLANDSDVEGPLTAVLTTGPANGTLTLNADGSFTYTPNANFSGSDSFTYQASDGTAMSAPVTVTLSIAAVNDPPVAVDDSTSTSAGVPVTINVLSNDSDADGDPLSLTLFSQGSQGTVSCTTTGSCTYTPNATATGSDSFTYKVSDGNGGQDDGVVFITITAICPNAPNPTFPAEGATNVPTSGTMSWDGSAEMFEVFFGPAGGGCSMSQGSLPGNTFRYAGLASDTEYEWRVVAGRTGCPNASSQCLRFRTVKTCTTAAPTPLSPVPAANVSSPITFSWTAVPGATNYKVFSVSGSSETLLGQTTSTSLLASLPDSASSWYVVAENVPGCGDLRSASVSFRVCNAPERPLASVIGESTSGQTYTVTWEAVPNANRYEVLEANNAAFVDAISFTTEALFMTFTKDDIQHATPFFYQVRAFSDCFNGPGASSPTIRVVVVPVPPRETPNTSANAPVGSTRPITIQVFVPGEPGRTFRFTAAGDQSWMTVRPESGELPESGITLEVTVDPRNLPNGTFTGTVIVSLIEPATGRISLNSNHTRSTPISINLVTPVTPISPGPPTASSLIIPAVGHLDGSDARWRSDVRIANTSLNVSRYLVTFTPGNPAQGVKQTSLEIGPGITTALDDIVRAWYGIGSLGESSNGVLEVRPLNTGSNSTFKADPPSVSLATVVTSRTYAQTQSGTLGEFIPGVLFSNFVGLAGSGQIQPILNLQQIAQNQAYRTNVGVVEASGEPVSVVLSIFNSAGDKLKDIPLGLKANEQRQLNSLLAENGIELADGRIEVKVTGGEGRVTAYAAVIDNRTKDQLFVPAATLGQFNSRRYVMPGIADLDSGSARWRSDMRIFNSGSTPQGATLTLHPQNNSGTPLTAAVTVEPGEVKVLDNIVRNLFGTSSMGGAVHVDTPTESSLVVTARTYNQTANGTLGLFIPAVTPQQAIGGGEKSLNLVQAEDSVRYRTNVGIAEVTGNPVTVEMMIHLPDSKVTPRIEIPLSGNEFRQIGVLRELGIGNVYNARVSMRVISGEGRITAYGSVIDMRTNDSTYVPAQ